MRDRVAQSQAAPRPRAPHQLNATLGWRISPHARKRATQRGITIAEALMVVVDPELRLPSRRGPGLSVLWRDGVKVVVAPASRMVKSPVVV